MSRDRLREMRAQQGYGAPVDPGQAGGYSQASGYSHQDNYGAPPTQPQPQYQQNQYSAPPATQQPGNYGGGGYEMQPVAASNLVDISTFFAEVDSIRTQIQQFRGQIEHVSELNSRQLATADDQATGIQANLAAVTAESSVLRNSIKNQIFRLNEKNKGSSRSDPAGFNTRKSQIEVLQTSFKRALEEYHTVEMKAREKYRQRIERQIRIVKPDATPDEVKAAIESSDGGQRVFSDALIHSRVTGATAAFSEVQSRNKELRKIEETIIQLAQMMNDMSTIVLEQDDMVGQTETNAIQAQKDVETGLGEAQKAVKSAKRARKMRWICFIILLIIVIIVAIVVAVEVTKGN